MANIKVSYFDFPGAAEPMRLLLAYGGEDFEDNRINPFEWLNIKDTMPFGQVPLYEEGGQLVNQSVAICRYLGNKYKLNGDNDWENLEIDAIGDTIRDFIFKVAGIHYEKSASTKERLLEEVVKTIDFYLEKFENVAKENNGYFAAKKLTWADFYWSGMIDYISLMMNFDAKTKYPNLEAVRQNVMKLPTTVKYYEDNPIDWEPVKQWLKFSGTTTEK